MKQLISKYFKFIILAALVYMPVFGHLNTLPIRLWDEARVAMNAYEMHDDGDYIVTHYDGKPDMWNTKPPLLIWFQVMFMKFLGVNELSVRLPSAFAAFFTCLALLIFSIRYLKKFWFGFIAVLVLITSHGYINVHASRTGDYDAMLAFFTTISCLFFFLFIESKKNKHLYLFFLSTALAVLTKSIVGLLFIPALAIYALWQMQIFSILKNKHFYIGFLSFLFVTVGYYLLREKLNHGYLAAVYENEFGGRFLNVVENHKQDFMYYYNNMIAFQFSTWYLLVPCGLIIGFLLKDKLINRFVVFSFLLIVTFFLIISSAQTKLEWYDVPLYPFLVIPVAMFIYYVFDLLKNFEWANNGLRYNILPFIFLFIISINPYRKIIEKTYLPKEYSWDKDFYEIGYYLKSAVKGYVDVMDTIFFLMVILPKMLFT